MNRICESQSLADKSVYSYGIYKLTGHLKLSEDALSCRHVVLFYSVPVSNSSLIAFVGFFFFVSYFSPTKTTTQHHHYKAIQ